MDVPDATTFKMLWRQLSKAGWKAKKPKGLSLDFTYVKPGVSGRLDSTKREKELMTFARRSGLLQFQVAPVAEITEGRSSDAEEEFKSEEGVADDVGVFDSDYFMEALRREQLFGPVAVDDVNVGEEMISDDEEDADDGGDALDVPAASLEYESDVDSDGDFEDDSDTFEQDDDAMRGLSWRIFDQARSYELKLTGATDFYNGLYGVTKSAAAFAKSPLGMFFYFLPKVLWLHIADKSNEYRLGRIPVDAEKIRMKQLDAQAKDPSKRVQPLADITSQLERVKPIKPHEVLHVIGLLVARTLCSHTDGLEKHWGTREDGAVPRGTFGRYMKRERFRIITRYLQFASKPTGLSARDKAWRVRPIIQAVEKTFRRGYRLGARVSFDEGTIPNRSQFNPIRVYNKDKPHKYGTKCYMTCCAETGYCARVEVYLGAVEDKKKAKGVAQKAVIRNVAKVFHGQQRQGLIIADNFYTSCALALRLRDMGFYYVGTHRNDRLGWPKSLEFKQKKRPKSMSRGTYRIAQDVDHPELVAVAWMDSSPVHMIAIGCSTIPTSVTRRNKSTGALDRVPCPQLIADYHAGMGGVDTHDQLRLQSYSLQQCVAFKKYYRQLFLGFVDMAVVNGFILHKLVLKKSGHRLPTHAEYMRRLHNELMGVSAATFEANMNAEELVTEPISAAKHRLRNNSNKYRRKRRQHSCKVCSAMAEPKTKSNESSFYCPSCELLRGGYVPLCAKVRRQETGNTLTCSQIWHSVWGCGTLIPVHLRKNIRYRKRKREDPDSEDSDVGEEHDVDYVDEGDSD
ncbi:Hypothetical protein PHPALM_17369 [Phytophthora palmivora]|uniref:PiggyBac transposable element-derived protein domain-containing protein n=1 Tax=Phytophthora palmivora TaxID=4796 RepID=A0A2P4XMD9_9STRA|nr:Hypothetical protein PHPALM_17369 [Phytophthora palmivora]